MCGGQLSTSFSLSKNRQRIEDGITKTYKDNFIHKCDDGQTNIDKYRLI